MRNLLLATVAAAAFAAPAFAADLPSRSVAPAFVAPVPVFFSWTGFYVGGQAGYGWNDSRWSSVAPSAFASFNNDAEGFVGGGHVGYNYQINQFVVGIEGQMNYTDISATTGASFGGTARTRQNYLGDINGKLGFAFDRVMVYATGGVAFTDYDFTAPTPAPFLNYGGGSRTGYTVGAGIDYAITNNWIAGVQYKYYDFGSRTSASTPAFNNVRFNNEENVVMGRISYKFGSSPLGAVVAKY